MHNLDFLNEFGLSDIQIKIYDYLLNNHFGSIGQIKNDLDYSYAVVRDNLRYLENNGFITASDGKPKMYFRSNPKIILTEILKKKNNTILERIHKLEEGIQALESVKGICTRNITFYHHSDINIGLEYIYELIDKAESEIILSSLPPSLLKKLERGLNRAFLNGIKIKLYYSKLDFESIDNYFGYITDILKNIKVEIIETNEKACRLVRFNDLIVNEGVILIDYYFNSVLFIDDSYFHFNGFYMPNMAISVRKMFDAKTCIKSIEINPDPIQNILDIIKNQEKVKTRELVIKSKISGAKLREILEFLVKERVIKEEIIKREKAGRPKHVYSIISE
ncbi:MAG: helix-turn-helix domain-containing protein [Candidatus Hermodarchaeota archaeon]